MLKDRESGTFIEAKGILIIKPNISGASACRPKCFTYRHNKLDKRGKQISAYRKSFIKAQKKNLFYFP